MKVSIERDELSAAGQEFTTEVKIGREREKDPSVTWVVVRQHVSAWEDHSSVFQLFRWVVTHTDVAVLGCVCEREGEGERERVCVCVRVKERERESEERETESVCERERERDRDRERELEKDIVCVL